MAAIYLPPDVGIIQIPVSCTSHQTFKFGSSTKGLSTTLWRHMVNEDISGYNMNFSTVLRWVVSLMPQPPYTPEKGPTITFEKKAGWVPEPNQDAMDTRIFQPLPGIQPNFLSVSCYIVTIPTEPLHFIFTTSSCDCRSSVTKCIIPCNFQYFLLLTCKALFFQVRIITFYLHIFIIILHNASK